MDESSINLNDRLPRVWQLPGRLVIPKSIGTQKNITMIGALSQHGGELFARIAETTNATVVEQFFLEMAEKHNLAGAVVITDNHRAHHSIRIRELFRELQC